MSLFHSFKRTVAKGKQITQDPIYDKLCQQFKDCEKQATSMQTAMRDSFKAWGSVKKNVLSAIDTASKSVGADETTQGFLQNAKRATEEISGEEVQSEGALRTAMETLNEYIAFCRETALKKTKRDDVAKDVDYYSGKLEDLQAKGDKTTNEKLNNAQRKTEECEQAYELAHEECVIALQKAVELKEDIFPRVVVAYIEAQNRMLTRDPYGELIDEHHHLLSTWPSIADYESRNPIAITRMSSGRGGTAGGRPNSLYGTTSGTLSTGSNSGGGPVAPPRPRPATGSTANKAKVMYDFDPETEQEISLKAGTFVTILEEVDENWLKGRNADGKVGIFPKAYVE